MEVLVAVDFRCEELQCVHACIRYTCTCTCTRPSFRNLVQGRQKLKSEIGVGGGGEGGDMIYTLCIYINHISQGRLSQGERDCG